MKNTGLGYLIVKRVYKSLIALSTLSFFIFMTQNSNASGFFDIFKSRPPEPPVYVPFDITKKGNKAEMTFRLTKDTGCVFGVSFKYKEGDRGDKDRVRNLTGTQGRGRHDEHGNYFDVPPEKLGIPTPVRLKIFFITDNQFELIFDQGFDPVLGSWGANTLTKIVKDILLKPGIYKVEIESLRDSPELIGEKIEFEVINPKR